VDLLRIAARVAATAGKTMLMMRDMGYDPQMIVYNATEAISKQQKTQPGEWEGVHARVNEAVLRAWKDAGLPDTGPHIRGKRMHDDPRNVIHELEHLILDPDFDLDSGKSASHSGVESVMEEVLSWGFSGAVEDDGKFIVGDSAPDYLFPGAKTVAEALAAIAGATISSPERRKIRDSAVHRLKTVFKDVMGQSLKRRPSETGGQALRKRLEAVNAAFGLSSANSLGGALGQGFTQLVESKYGDWKQVMTEEREDGWRKFNLHLKAEMRKLAPGVHSKSPRQVQEEQAGPQPSSAAIT
jgi:hypothetical protein